MGDANLARVLSEMLRCQYMIRYRDNTYVVPKFVLCAEVQEAEQKITPERINGHPLRFPISIAEIVNGQIVGNHINKADIRIIHHLLENGTLETYKNEKSIQQPEEAKLELV